MKLSRTFLVLGTIIVALIAVSTWLNLATIQLGADIQDKHEERFQAFAIANEFRQTSMDLTRLSRTYAATGDEQYSEQYWNIVEWRAGDAPRPSDAHSDLRPGETVDQRDIMAEIGFTDEEFAMLNRITNMSNDLVELEDQSMETVRTGEVQPGPGSIEADESPQDFAVRILYDEAYSQEVAVIWDTVDDFVEMLDERIFAEIAEMESRQQILSTLALISLIVVALVIIGLVVFMLRTVLRRILGGEPSELAEKNWEISRGNLTTSVEVRDGDTVSLAASMKSMIESLVEIVRPVSDAGTNVSGSSNQISQSSQQLSKSTAEQASSIEQVSSSVEELSAGIKQNADNATETEKIAKKAAEDATESGNAVQQTVDAMNQIAEKNEIVGELARQTNLLALNAAIEAARAGEQGKGFAVVASEVRKLAERSQTAAGEIGDLTKSSVDVSNHAGEMLRELVPGIQKTAELVQEISAASREQSGGLAQIESAVQQINETTQTGASSAEELASMSEELAAQAESLEETIAFFTIDNTEAGGMQKRAGMAGRNGNGNSATSTARFAAEHRGGDQSRSSGSANTPTSTARAITDKGNRKSSAGSRGIKLYDIEDRERATDDGDDDFETF